MGTYMWPIPGNNRILRFPKPTTQQDQFPDMVIGQPNFKSREVNQGNLLPGKKIPSN